MGKYEEIRNIDSLIRLSAVGKSIQASAYSFDGKKSFRSWSEIKNVDRGMYPARHCQEILSYLTDAKSSDIQININSNPHESILIYNLEGILYKDVPATDDFTHESVAYRYVSDVRQWLFTHPDQTKLIKKNSDFVDKIEYAGWIISGRPKRKIFSK